MTFAREAYSPHRFKHADVQMVSPAIMNSGSQFERGPGGSTDARVNAPAIFLTRALARGLRIHSRYTSDLLIFFAL